MVLPWAIAAALLVAPLAKSAGAGIAVFAFRWISVLGFLSYDDRIWRIDLPQHRRACSRVADCRLPGGARLAALGAGALQRLASLSTVFRIAAAAVVVMGFLALVVARQQRPSHRTPCPVLNDATPRTWRVNIVRLTRSRRTRPAGSRVVPAHKA